MKLEDIIHHVSNFLFGAHRIVMVAPPNGTVTDLVVSNLDSVDDTRMEILVAFIGSLKKDFDYPIELTILGGETFQHYLFTYKPNYATGILKADVTSYLCTCVAMQLQVIADRVAVKQRDLNAAVELQSEVQFLFDRLSADL
jgi:hypothetical protein